jgi:Uma2 family endonuclease
MYDARQKLSLYARAGIREYWLVDLVRGQVEANSDPEEGRHRARYIASREDQVSSASLPMVTIRVADIID